jgi:hypothetical protein
MLGNFYSSFKQINQALGLFFFSKGLKKGGKAGRMRKAV